MSPYLDVSTHSFLCCNAVWEYGKLSFFMGTMRGAFALDGVLVYASSPPPPSFLFNPPTICTTAECNVDGVSS